MPVGDEFFLTWPQGVFDLCASFAFVFGKHCCCFRHCYCCYFSFPNIFVSICFVSHPTSLSQSSSALLQSSSASSSWSTSSICPALDSSARLARFTLSFFLCFCFPHCLRCNSLVCLHLFYTRRCVCQYEYILYLLLVLLVAYVRVELLMAMLHWGSGSCNVLLLVRIFCEK